MVHDQFHDPALSRLANTLQTMPELEDYVKTASMDSAEIEMLPDTAFGWPEERRFPLHSAEHAALSYAYSKTASEKIPAFVASNIKKAMDVYGVPEKLFVTVKIASVENPEDWLCPDLKLFSVKTASEIPVAQNAFLAEYEKLDVPHRKMAAQNLVKRAQVFGKAVHPLVSKVAGMTVSHIPTLREWVSARAAAAVKEEHKSAYQKFAAELQQLPEESRDCHALMKIAQGLGELDQRAQLERYYDRKLPDPLLSVFNTEKIAEDTIDIEGMMVPLRKLQSLPATFWEDLGGPELKNELAPGGKLDPAKIKTVVATLPMDLKRVIKAQLR